MFHRSRCARINVKLLVVLIVVTVALGVSLVAARQIHRSALSERALAAGEAAFGSKDWPAAVKNYRRYLGRNPDNIEILRKYAEACLSIRPLDAATVGGAISAYRRVMQLTSFDETACERLAMLYGSIGNFGELASIARARIEHDPNDRQGPLWLAEALIRLNKTAAARQTLQTLIEDIETLPDRHVEYVRACVQMSQLADSATSPQPETPAGAENAAPPTPLEWLNKAVEYAPDSVEALVCRAQFHRRTAGSPDANEQGRSASLALARQDFDAADAHGTDDPRIRLVLGAEWMAFGELDRVAAELRAVDKLLQEKLEAGFFDVGDWTVARFLLASELATRKGAATEAA